MPLLTVSLMSGYYLDFPYMIGLSTIFKKSGNALVIRIPRLMAAISTLYSRILPIRIDIDRTARASRIIDDPGS